MSGKRVTGIAVLTLLLYGAGCRDDGPLAPAELPSEGEVFLDQYGSGVTFQAFAGSKLDAVQVDATVAQSGSASLRVAVPGAGDPTGGYAGGAFTTTVPRDLSDFDALTFWARAATAAELDVAGFGNDNTGATPYLVEARGLSLTTTWRKYVIPIPVPSDLVSEDGLFFFAEGAEEGASNTIWFDEVQFESLGTLANPRPTMVAKVVTAQVGTTLAVEGLAVTFDVAGTDVTVSAAPAYFTFTSSNPSVATVNAAGVITVVGEGTATVTATLDGVTATGAVEVGTVAPPATAAPTPTVPAADVVSMFSDAYPDVTVDTWSAQWDMADVTDVTVAGNAAKLYTSLVFAGIEATSAPIDASAMTHFHIDVWTPDPTAAPAALKIKLVDFGADGAFAGGDDVEHEITVDATYSTPLATGAWVSLDIPLAEFAGLTTRGHIAQLILSGDPNTVYVDNVYFYRTEVTAPAVPAPTPTEPAANVVSLFSDAYADVTVDTWSAVWDQADVADVDIAGNAAKLYTNLVFAGIEAGSAPIDASATSHFHMDVWTPDPTASPAALKIKLVDFGADGGFGGGDDVEHEITVDAAYSTPLATGTWVSLDVPLTEFANLTTRGHIAQLIISGDPNTLYVDNVYFYAGEPQTPVSPAPTPTYAAGDAISLFSDAYTNVTVDTWSAVWDMADVADVNVAGNATKLYTNLVFAGIEAGSAPINATAMTHFRMDVWTPDPTGSPAALRIKLVDFGADGAFGGGDDVEHEITVDASYSTPLATGAWVSLDIPLTAFANLATRGHIAQLILSGDPNTVYVDNILFHR
jgi:hypothetical protein